MSTFLWPAAPSCFDSLLFLLLADWADPCCYRQASPELEIDWRSPASSDSDGFGFLPNQGDSCLLWTDQCHCKTYLTPPATCFDSLVCCWRLLCLCSDWDADFTCSCYCFLSSHRPCHHRIPVRWSFNLSLWPSVDGLCWPASSLVACCETASRWSDPMSTVSRCFDRCSCCIEILVCRCHLVFLSQWCRCYSLVPRTCSWPSTLTDSATQKTWSVSSWCRAGLRMNPDGAWSNSLLVLWSSGSIPHAQQHWPITNADSANHSAVTPDRHSVTLLSSSWPENHLHSTDIRHMSSVSPQSDIAAEIAVSSHDIWLVAPD